MDVPDPCRPSDEQLALLAQSAGEQSGAAVNELLERYKDTVRIKSRAFFLMGADAEDVIQEGMIGLYSAIMNFDAGKGVSFPSYAAVCIVNQIRTAVLAGGRLKNQALNGYVSLFSDVSAEEGNEYQLIEVLPAPAAATPEELYLEKERTGILLRKLGAYLSPLEKRVLGLYLEGRDYVEIARELERSSKSVDNALQRIRKKCLDLLEREKNT
mgnify:CR=1 FL=1